MRYALPFCSQGWLILDQEGQGFDLDSNSTEEKERDRGRGRKQKEKKTNQVRGQKEKHVKKHIDIQSRALTINFLLLRPVSRSYHYA